MTPNDLRSIAAPPPADARALVPRATRYPMSVVAQYRVSGFPWREAFVENMSRSGILVSRLYDAPIGTVVEMTFDLPPMGTAAPARVSCQGRVVRIAASEPAATPAVALAITHYRLAPRSKA